MHVLYLVIALVFNALANILIKLANTTSTVADTAPLVQKVTGLYLSWPFIAGLCAFGLNLLFYTQALHSMQLSVAYPIMTGSGFAIIGAAGYFLFAERLTFVQMAGIGLILIGIVLVAQQGSSS
jgi:multidrug transporter EmrE-like cation transporter